MRRLAFVGVVAAPLALLFACQPKNLELGANDLPGDEVGPAPETPEAAAEASTTTLETLLLARCDAGSGARDKYSSAADLSQKISGRWYLCTDVEHSPLYNDGIEFTATHEWHRLVWADGGRDELVRSDDPEMNGTLRCVAFADVSGDGGHTGDASTTDVPCDDPTPRYPLFVYLQTKTISEDPQVLSFDLEKDPRRAYGTKGGISNETADLVPVE